MKMDKVEGKNRKWATILNENILIESDRQDTSCQDYRRPKGF